MVAVVVAAAAVTTDSGGGDDSDGGGGGDGGQYARQPLYPGSVVVPLSFQFLGPNTPEVINFCARKFYFGL